MTTSILETTSSPIIDLEDPDHFLGLYMRSGILVADDDPDQRSLISYPLRRRGYLVTEVEDGTQLLDYIGSSLLELENDVFQPHAIPSVLICDIRMPGFNGLQIVAGMKRWGWSVPVILISALDDPYVYDEASRLKVAAYFHKPFNVTNLCRTVETLAGGL